MFEWEFVLIPIQIIKDLRIIAWLQVIELIFRTNENGLFPILNFANSLFLNSYNFDKNCIFGFSKANSIFSYNFFKYSFNFLVFFMSFSSHASISFLVFNSKFFKFLFIILNFRKLFVTSLIHTISSTGITFVVDCPFWHVCYRHGARRRLCSDPGSVFGYSFADSSFADQVSPNCEPTAWLVVDPAWLAGSQLAPRRPEYCDGCAGIGDRNEYRNWPDGR